MLNRLTLTNFKCHENLELNFATGLNAIRGANEAGKSSLYQAVAYAFYGARALPLSLEETVTWSKNPSTLKVRLEFSHAGLDYIIERKKSGASLSCGNLLVSGQSEVTGYIESLFRANMAVGSATLIANQGGLQDALDGTAVSLIEKLSNMSLIDDYVGLIQKKLPSGNTAVFEKKLIDFGELAEPITDFSGLELELQTAGEAVKISSEALAQVTANWEASKISASLATDRIQQQVLAKSRREALQAQEAQILRTLAEPKPLTTETWNLETLEGARLEQASAAQTRRAWELFTQLPVVTSRQTRALWLETQATVSAEKARLKTEFTKLTNDKAKVYAMGIWQDTCSLCKKDLRDVPEVATINASVLADLAAIDSQLAAVADRLKAVALTEQELASIKAEDTQVCLSANRIADYVSVDQSFIPTVVTWIERHVTDVLDGEDYASRIKALIQYQTLAAKHEASMAKAQAERADIKEKLAAATVPDLLAGDDKASELRDANLAVMREAAANDSEARRVEQSARHALETARLVLASARTAWEVAVASKAETQALLTQYNTNNVLIKRLREVRPIVARKLWNSVLSAVSTYFSTLRGTPSTVTRTDTQFLVDGRPVGAFSGSTKDCLGLAIRITLQKTFLGALDFIMCDEIASAADDTREAAMLGLLATCGYGQVILVTHSALADSFAANSIVI